MRVKLTIALLLISALGFAQTMSINWLRQSTYTASGTNTYTVTATGVTQYVAGLELKILFTNANTGASTINVNSLGARTLQKNGAALASGDIAAGGTYRITFDGTNFQVLGIGGSGGGGGVTAGDKGDITVTLGPENWTIDNNAVTNAKINDVGWSKITGTPTSLSGYGITDAWSLASGGTLTGVNTITSNTANQLNYTGTFTATANNQYYQDFSGTITGRSTASDNLFHTVIDPTMTAGANFQALTAVHINPTVNTGGFSGVLSNPFVVGPISQPWLRVRAGAHLFGNSNNTNAITFLTGGADSFITFSGANAGYYNHTGGLHIWQQNGTNRFWVGNFAGVAALGLIADGATATSTATQRSGFPQVSQLSMWNGAAAVTRSWVYRSTASTSVNDESFFDIGYASAGGTTIDGIRLRTSSTGTHLIGASADVPTASVRHDVRGAGTDNTTSAGRWANSANTQLMRLFNGGSLLLGGTTLTNNNTIFDIQSTTQGVAFPRMTTTQRDAIASPYSGLFIYNNSSNALNFHNGTAWQSVLGSQTSSSDLGSANFQIQSSSVKRRTETFYAASVDGTSWNGAFTQTNILNTVPNNSVIVIRATFIGLQTSGTPGSSGFHYVIERAFRRNATTTSAIAPTTTIVSSNDTGDTFTLLPTLTTSGSNINFERTLSTTKTFLVSLKLEVSIIEQ